MSQDDASHSRIDLDALRTEYGFTGVALAATDPGFAEMISGGLWNQRQPDRAPQAVAQVATEQDVVAAVRFARANGIPVSVRGGGHNWCAPSQRNAGLLIDLHNLNQIIAIDVEARTAVLQPILTNREVQAALNPLGLSFPTGHCPTVKVSGYLLSGGMAWNHGVWGPGVGSVEAIDLVTADGQLIRASAEENADYFWAARGAGPGFFGVALRYHLKLYPMPQAIIGSVYHYPYDAIEDVAAWLGPLANQLPPSVELSLFVVPAPPELAAQAAASNGWEAMVTATMFAETAEEAAATLAALDASPVMDRCLAKSVAQPTTFEALFDASGALWPEGLRSQVDALFYNAPLAEIIAATKDHVQTAPSPKTVFMFAIFTGGGAPATPPDAAFSMTGALYGGAWTAWEDAADDAANTAWHTETMRLLEPYVVGHYVSETDTVAHPEYAERAYSPENWRRLAELRRMYDPDGVFFGFTGGLD